MLRLGPCLKTVRSHAVTSCHVSAALIVCHGDDIWNQFPNCLHLVACLCGCTGTSQLSNVQIGDWIQRLRLPALANPV